MSKIADYLEQQENERVKAQEQREKETVADFAKELKKSPDALLIQLRKAGVQKNSETDRLTEADKQALLRFLQDAHGVKGGRKKISVLVDPPGNRLLRAVAGQENGAEWECLEHFVGDVMAGNCIDPDFQAVVNLIVAKAFIFQALPMKKLGRPKSQEAEDLGRKTAQEYWDLRDGGSTYSEAVLHLAKKIHKDERHVMRFVEKHKISVGLTVEDREKKRSWAKVIQTMYSNADDQPASALSCLLDSYRLPGPEFTGEDYTEYLDELIVKTVTSRIPTGIKETVFIASDSS